MSKIVSVHSFRGGTGKSNTTANVAVTTASQGLRVGIIDTDIQSPGIHVIFGMDQTKIKRTLNDYLWNRCGVEETAYDVTPPEVSKNQGKVFLIPSSMNIGEISRILREGYNVALLNNGFKKLVSSLELDYLFIDTHPGINEETLLSVTISNILLIILRPDRQDFQGTAVTVDVARKLNVAKLLLVVNRVPQKFDINSVRQQVETTYNATVAGVLPNCEEMMELQSSDLFCLRYPDHYISKEIRGIVDHIYEKPKTVGGLKKFFGR
ncbi:MAG: MinD/ParA family protein [Coleofasciculus chthonoplastes F3-SA18-01]|uniref:MinD/ParA family ATP-binding protein n=1 Tax=Coleofasciculus chthonoplastes TaxID=64178 RepID=UPI003301D599